MSRSSMHSLAMGQTRSSAPSFDKFAVIPILACVYATIVGPLIDFGTVQEHATPQSMLEPGVSNRVFWPAVAAISVALALANYSRLRGRAWPPTLIFLFAYVAFAGASILWALKPEISFTRYLQQVMILSSIFLPAMLASRSADLMRGLFVCFALAVVLNILFIFDNSAALVKKLNGYPGYFLGKNYLGEFSTIALFLSLYETRYLGVRRAFAIVIAILAATLLVLSNSKTALGLAFLIPLLAFLTLWVGKIMRVSPATILVFLLLCCVAFSVATGFNSNRLSYVLYGDPTFTGRTTIWDFASKQIERRPLLGWGYQSFWLVGPDAPSVVEAPGWVKTMPNAHNGYYDTMLELGYVGLALLVAFIISTLHAVGRMTHRDPARAWLALSLVLYIVFYNFLESIWMRGFEMAWVMYAVVVAEIGRYWQPAARKRSASGPMAPRPIRPGS